MPLAIILIAFNPVSLSVALILAEALTTANVLATTEALVRGVSDDDSSSSSTSNSSIEARKSKGGFFYNWICLICLIMV